jgi:hypothetical protein
VKVGRSSTVAPLGAVALAGLAMAATSQEARTVEGAFPPRITCWGPPFRPAALSRRRGYERRDTPSARALRRFLQKTGDEYGPRHGWFRMVRRGGRLQFGAGRGPLYAYMFFELHRGRWSWAGSGDGCEPRWSHDGLEASTWRLDPDFPPPASADRKVHVLVQEDNCASGRDAEGRILRPLAHYGPNAITLVYFIRPLEGAQTCQGVPPTPAVVRLAEPLGGRELRDGGPYPSRRRLPRD